MAYDQYGNFIDDDGLGDFADEMEEQEAIREWERNERIAKKVYAKRMAEAQNKFMGESWQEALAEAGIDQATYEQLAAQDPAFVQGVIRDSMKNLTKSVRTRARDSQGRFISNQAAQQTGQGQKMREPAQRQGPRLSKEELQAKARAGKIRDQEIIDILPDLF